MNFVTGVNRSLTSEPSTHSDSGDPHSSPNADELSPLITRCIPPVWANVRAVRTSVRELLLEYPREFNHAATMVSSELLENAIKYGEEVAGASMIQFHLGRLNSMIQVKVVNGSTDSVAVDELMCHVRLVRESIDKGALYQARLEELLMHPHTSAKLGIYRIAHEGRFDIDCTYINEVVTVTATRSLP